MILRITKELTSKSTVRIKKIIKNTNFLCDLPDGAFLANDSKMKNIILEKDGWLQNLLDQDIEPILVPKNELIKIKDGNMYCSTLLINPRINQLKFILDISRWSNSYYSSSVNLYIIDKKKHLVVFKIISTETEIKQNIYAIATFFYNKFFVYKKIQELLLENKENLREKIGEEYLEDLMQLFSIKKQIKKSESFTFSQKNNKIEYLNKKMSYKKREKIGTANISFFINKQLVDIPIVLSLRNSNLLTFDFFLPNTEPVSEIQFKNFVEKISSVWLESLEQVTILGLNIYRKVKMKILLSNT